MFVIVLGTAKTLPNRNTVSSTNNCMVRAITWLLGPDIELTGAGNGWIRAPECPWLRKVVAVSVWMMILCHQFLHNIFSTSSQTSAITIARSQMQHFLNLAMRSIGHLKKAIHMGQAPEKLNPKWNISRINKKNLSNGMEMYYACMSSCVYVCVHVLRACKTI